MAVRSLVIAVLTYLRPVDLAAVLPLLIDQAKSVRSDELSVSVLVIDNDPESSARPVVDGCLTNLSSDDPEVRYVLESEPGISAGRNRALAESIQHDALVFIDDDERPSKRWLEFLLAAQAEYRASVVQGPVFSEFEVEPDSWIRAGDFFRRRRLATGTMLDVAVTNNLLLDLNTVRRIGLSFDPTLGTTGGEDTLFTRLLHRGGARMVWCAEAFVIDVVPATRSTRRWVVQRAISMGNAAALVDTRLETGPVKRLLRRLALVGRGLIRVLAGGAQTLAGAALRNERQNARGTRTLLRGVGMCLGACGFEYHEYGRKKES